MKQIKPIYLYVTSLLSFVFANISREKNDYLYAVLLGLGLVFFLFGVLNKFRNK
jgi:hypothetical protein